jgi:hypothetical protein
MAKKLSTTKKGKAIYPAFHRRAGLQVQQGWRLEREARTDSGNEGAAIIVAAIDEAMKAALVEAKEKYATAKQEYAALKNKSRQEAAEGTGALVDKPYFVDEENDTVTFTFKMTASGESKKTREVHAEA